MFSVLFLFCDKLGRDLVGRLALGLLLGRLVDDLLDVRVDLHEHAPVVGVALAHHAEGREEGAPVRALRGAQGGTRLGPTW